MRIAALIAAAALLAGCQTPCPVADMTPVAVTYKCEDGSDLNVTYFRSPNRARVEQEGYSTLDLPSRVSGTGYRYADEGAELRGRSREVRWLRPGAAETICEISPPAPTQGARPSAHLETAIGSCRG
jgi:hypothetical protein